MRTGANLRSADLTDATLSGAIAERHHVRFA
jgi:uncharacterized protein YjbI with pentapeptide repeats